MRLPTPLSEYCRRYPEVTLELRTGNGEQVSSDVLTGDDRCRRSRSEPIPDAPFEKVPIYNEELVLIAAAGHPPIRSARDVAVANHSGVRAGLSVAQAAGGLVRAAPATCRSA